jgi:hypothetical protein
MSDMLLANGSAENPKTTNKGSPQEEHFFSVPDKAWLNHCPTIDYASWNVRLIFVVIRVSPISARGSKRIVEDYSASHNWCILASRIWLRYRAYA